MKSSRKQLARAVLMLPIMASLSACGGSDPAQPVACAALPAEFKAQDVALTSATEVPAAAATATVAATPAYCDVRGTIRGNIKFAVYLPKDWNGRFQMVGNGGKAGSISLADMRTALLAGYASTSTDTGHDNAITEQGGARFGNNQLFGDDREIDFGYRAVHLTATTAKSLIGTHYARKASYSYWNGCSSGGRQGLQEAQRFPDDFDGYVVGAANGDYTGQQMSAPAYMQPLYKKIPPAAAADGPVLSPAKRVLIGNAIYARCDGRDGVVDGQLRNPTKCDFDPARDIPACTGGSTDNCLTPAELSAVKQIYAGKEPFVPGMPLGGEIVPGSWDTWVLPEQNRVPTLHSIMVDAFEWLMFTPDKPGFDYLTQWDWNVHPFQMQKAAETFNATNPDLRKLLDSGKKVVMYHGWNDAAVNPLRSIRYRQAVIDHLQANGGNGEERTNGFLRLFMVPGMAHCSGGTGHSTVDWLAPAVNWVEKGVAPTSIVGSKTGSTRPHCPYPQEAVYDGTGNKDSASSYACKTVN
jgi:feruloyl esterase